LQCLRGPSHGLEEYDEHGRAWSQLILKGDALEQHLARRGDCESVSHEDAERPSMAAYEMPLDGEDEEKSK
jgi:hypothetical protein